MENEKNMNALSTISDASALMAADAGNQLIYCSLTADDAASRKKLYNALNGDSQKIGDFIGKQIVVKDVVAETATFVDEESGEVDETVKITLIDVFGVAYVAYSKGIFRSIKRLFGAFGTPDMWEEPITVEVKQVTRGKFKSLALFVV